MSNYLTLDDLPHRYSYFWQEYYRNWQNTEYGDIIQIVYLAVCGAKEYSPEVLDTAIRSLPRALRDCEGF